MFDKDTKIFTTNAGFEIKIKTIKPFKIQRLEGSVRARYVKEGEPVDPPSYYVETVGGGKQKHYQTPKTIYQEKVSEDGKVTLTNEYRESLTSEEIAAWEYHQDALERMNAEVIESGLNIILREGCEFDMPEDSDWQELQESDGITIPAHPKNRAIHWLITEEIELTEAAQIANVIMSISQGNLNNILEEVQDTEDMFPDSLQEQSRPASEGVATV